MEDFVTYEITQKLKEKGYPIKRKISGILGLTKLECIDDLPTISQVLKWLRDEKKVHIGFGYSPRKKWRYVVMYMDDRFYNKPTLTVDGFIRIEQASLAGIEYVLNNLI